jgi:N-acetylglucosaminyl-diphospho-decaprenol L-rhamnosyltransferase
MAQADPRPLGVVIPAFNAADVIGECLSSLLPFATRVEIVVVDNASRDGTGDLAERHGVGAKVLRMDSNLGFGGAINAGMKALSTSTVLILNPDAAVTDVDFDAIERLQSQTSHGLLAITDAHDEAGPYLEPGPVRDAFEQIVQRPLLRRAPESVDGSKLDRPIWISGWGMLVRRDEFLGFGGFDERYFIYYEDRDLSRRYREAGLPVGLTGAVVAIHDRGTGASDEEFPQGVRTAYSLLSFAEYQQRGRLGFPAPITVFTLVAMMVLARGLLLVLFRLRPGDPRLERRARAIESTLATLARLNADPGPAARAYPQARRALPAAVRLLPASFANPKSSRHG